MSRYIRYEITNIEPIRIANDNASQLGQVATQKFIPGTAIRGLVIERLKEAEGFEKIKAQLFSKQVKFLNAYIKESGHELLPTPKGFYEDKAKVVGKKAVENVVLDGNFTPGYKRASLGNYCYIEDGCIYYYNVECGSDLKIKVNLIGDEKRNVFRNDYVKAGYTFVGYIGIEDKDLAECIKDIFKGNIYLGNARSQGRGKCKVIGSTSIIDELPYQSYAVSDMVSDYVYMFLLSDMTMLGEDGEPVGINEMELAKLLGVSKVEVLECSTSTVEICGYNRKLATKTASITAYEKGSVFKLGFKGESVSKEQIQTIMHQGIGIQKNIGMGRVLFLKDYEAISYKESKSHEVMACFGDRAHATDQELLKLLAKNYYRNLLKGAMARAALPDDAMFGSITLSNSQIGRVEAILQQNRYDVIEARKTLDKHFHHEQEKEKNHKKQDNKVSIKGLKEFVYYVLDNPVDIAFDDSTLKRDTIFTVPISQLMDDTEISRFKIEFILMKIRMQNRKGIK